MKWLKGMSVFCAGIAGMLCLSGCGLAGQRGEPHGIATTSMAVCQILDRLNIDELVGITGAAEDI